MSEAGKAVNKDEIVNPCSSYYSFFIITEGVKRARKGKEQETSCYWEDLSRSTDVTKSGKERGKQKTRGEAWTREAR